MRINESAAMKLWLFSEHSTIRIAGLALLTAVAFLVYGCGFGPAPDSTWSLSLPAPAATSTAENAGLTITLWHAATKEQQEVLSALVEEFNAENEGHIAVRAEHQDDYGYLRKKILAAIALGTPPDLTIDSRSQIAVYAEADAIVPLDGYVEEEGPDLADFFPAILDAERYPASGHRLMSLPLDRSLEVMFYNVDLLKKADLEGKPPQTWEEFAAMCEAVTGREVKGYTLLPEASLLIGWILSRGGQLVSQDGTKALFNEEAGIEALTLVDDLLIDGQAYLAADFDDILNSFAGGKVAFVMDCTDNLPAYIEATTDEQTGQPKFEWSVAPFPHDTAEPVVFVRGSSLAILATTPEREKAAWTFARWLTKGQWAARWALASNRFPVRRAAAETEEMKAYFGQKPLYAKAFSFLPYGQEEPAIAEWEIILGLLRNAVADVVDLGQSPRKALDVAEVEAEAVLVR